MATNVLSLRPACIRACAASGHQNPGAGQGQSRSSWWTPIFGWSSDADYINSSGDGKKPEGRSVRLSSEADTDSRRPRFAPGGFTEEKARLLRMKTTETTTFHDVMYHSAIASRLASDFKDRPDL